ncbi:hypothetical protein ACJX0J_008111 [Zea mays]
MATIFLLNLIVPICLIVDGQISLMPLDRVLVSTDWKQKFELGWLCQPFAKGMGKTFDYSGSKKEATKIQHYRSICLAALFMTSKGKRGKEYEASPARIGILYFDAPQEA